MKKKTFWILLTVFLLIFSVSTFFLVREISQKKHTKDLYADLASQVRIEPADVSHGPGPIPEPAENRPEPEASEAEPEENPVDGELQETETERTTEEPEILPEYEAVAKLNPDMIGWLYVEGTNISLPVMYSPDRPDFYLKHDFTEAQNRYGCLYIQEDCDPIRPSDNLIIHGHNMRRDQMMFAELELFLDEDFWENHRTIRFDTLRQRGTYEILSVARTAVDEFQYYNFTDADTQEEFDTYVNRCKSISLYDTGVTASYGDRLITLSTCIYHKQGGRLIVVAKRIE